MSKQEPHIIQKFSTTRDGVKGILTKDTFKGDRPPDRPGWDLYEGPKWHWAWEQFEPLADCEAEKREGNHD